MKFRRGKETLVIGIILIAVAVLFGIAFTVVFGEDGFIVVLLMMFLGLPLAGCGIWLIYNYKNAQEAIESALKKYGESEIIENIECATVKIYRTPSSAEAVYFTDRLIVAAGQAIFSYDEICVMYKSQVKSRYAYSQYADCPFIVFKLLNGKTYSLCSYIKDEEINEIFQICYQRNPDILWGKTKENRRIYKRKVKN